MASEALNPNNGSHLIVNMTTTHLSIDPRRLALALFLLSGLVWLAGCQNEERDSRASEDTAETSLIDSEQQLASCCSESISDVSAVSSLARESRSSFWHPASQTSPLSKKSASARRRGSIDKCVVVMLTIRCEPLFGFSASEAIDEIRSH